MDVKALEKRLEDLEVANAYQRETIESMNEIITGQWKEIDRLSKLMDQILAHLRSSDGPGGNGGGSEPPPPHY